MWGDLRRPADAAASVQDQEVVVHLAFVTEPYPIDWLDTSESQKVLMFQRHTLQDYIQEVRLRLGFRRYLIRLFRSMIRIWILKKSPVLK